jgi:hypothetical protein
MRYFFSREKKNNNDASWIGLAAVFPQRRAELPACLRAASINS